MYTIYELPDNSFRCEVQIQDGTERFPCKTRLKAIQEVISSARILNGTYITEEDIKFVKVPPTPPRLLTETEAILLDDIKRGQKVVFDCNDIRAKMKITEADCRILQGLREGDYELARVRDD